MMEKATGVTYVNVQTGEELERGDEPSPTRASVLVRLSHSHIRIGTFQFFAARGDTDGVRQLADHVIARHYPDIANAQRPYHALLAGVIARQAELVARWAQVAASEARICQVRAPFRVLLPQEIFRAITAGRSWRSARLLVASTPS